MLSLPDLITRFRQQFPHSSLTADLITLHNDQYVVQATVMSPTGQPLATAFSSHQQIEIAEDQAKQRALASLNLGADAAQPAPAEPAKPPLTSSPPFPQSDYQSASQPAVSPPPSLSPPPPPPQRPEPAPSRPAIPSLDAASPAPAPAPDLDFPSPPDDDWDAESWGPPVTEPPVPTPAAAAVSPPAPAQSPAPASTPVAAAVAPSDPTPVTDLSDVIAQTSVELSRLGWTVQQGRQYLEQTYNKRSRQDLTDEELFSFLFYLESLPTPAP